MDDNEQALDLCRQAESMDANDPRGALELKRRIWEELQKELSEKEPEGIFKKVFG